ncbi:hypothetical protein [Streptomyces sp. SM1]|uniref:hypothetical protein n=1 Tax=Streptomyces sp. SM1 TaxID=402229 RepID=UPI000CD55A0C|nr:hypothetical protein [Streptomyces sp. SM1]
MTMQHRRVWGLSVLLALALLVGGGFAFWKIQESATRLTIKIEGLPSKARPTLTVTGASGFKQSVTASTTLSVPPGTVRVAPAPVKSARATYYTPDDVLTTEVGSGRSERLTVDYRIAVADKARILDYSDPGLAEATTGKDKELLFRADAESAQNLKVGDILLAAEGPKTPQGLLRRVVSRERRGDLLAVGTSPAQLSEAMPKAVLRFERTSSGASSAEPAVQPASYRADDPSEDGEMAIRMDTWQGKGKLKGVKCGTGIPLLKLETTRPQIDLAGTDLGFNLPDVAWAQVQARFQYSAKWTFGTPHGAHCSWEYDAPTKLRLPPWTARLLRVGPFSMQPEVEFIAGIEARASTGMKVESEGREDFTVKSRLSLLPYASASVDGWPGKYETRLSGATEGKLKGKIGLRLSMKASDPVEFFTAGFFIEAALAAEGGIEPAKPEAKVEAFWEGGIGMKVEPPGQFKERQIGASFPGPKWTLWKSKDLMPPLAYATDRAIKVKSGAASPDTVASLPVGAAARQLTWSPSGKQLAWTTEATALGQSDGRVYLADLTTGKIGSWECSCQISFIGNKLLSRWNSLGGEEAGFAWYQIGKEAASAVQLDNPEILHQGQTDEEALEVARNYCGTGGCSTMDLYGGAANTGDSLIGIRWNDCRTKVFRVNSQLQASAMTVADLAYDSVVEPGPDGQWLMSTWNHGGCEGFGKQGRTDLVEVTKKGQLSTAPLPSSYRSWMACYLWYDEKKTPHAVLAPAVDDGDIWADEEPCVQQPPRNFRTLKKNGNLWEESTDSVLLRRTQGDWSAELHVGGRLTAENPKQEQRMEISERVKTFAWSAGTK